MQYKNVGGPWRRSNGQLIPRNGIFTPTPREIERMTTRRQIGLLFEPVVEGAAPESSLDLSSLSDAEVQSLANGEEKDSATAETESAPGDEKPAGEGESPVGGEQPAAPEQSAGEEKKPEPEKPKKPAKWTLAIAPALYLKMHPTGPNAELAQAHVTYEAANA